MDGATLSDSVGVLISAASISSVGQTGASTLSNSTSLSCTIRVTASNGWYHDYSGVTIAATPAYDAGYKAGQESMGLEVKNNTVSVVVSKTKSITANLSDNHRVGHDGRVTLTPGTMFTGTPGAYYLNATLLGSSSISWS